MRLPVAYTTYLSWIRIRIWIQMELLTWDTCEEVLVGPDRPPLRTSVSLQRAGAALLP